MIAFSLSVKDDGKRMEFRSSSADILLECARPVYNTHPHRPSLQFASVLQLSSDKPRSRLAPTFWSDWGSFAWRTSWNRTCPKTRSLFIWRVNDCRFPRNDHFWNDFAKKTQNSWKYIIYEHNIIFDQIINIACSEKDPLWLMNPNQDSFRGICENRMCLKSKVSETDPKKNMWLW